MDYRTWESDLTAAANNLHTKVNQSIDDPPQGKRLTAAAQQKLNEAIVAANTAVSVANQVVNDVHEDLPPPGQPNVFGRNQYVLDHSQDIPGITQASGLTAGPNGSLWVVTDSIESGGFLHEIDTSGNRLRSINLVSTMSRDPEDIAYMGEASPGIGLWAMCSEAGNKGVFVFEMPHSQADQSSVDLDQFWFHPVAEAGESMCYHEGNDELHLCSSYDYVIVKFDRTNHTFTTSPGPFDPTQFSGSNRTGVRSSSFMGSSLFRLRASTSSGQVQELDYTTAGLAADDRVISTFDDLRNGDGFHPKAEGGPVFSPTGDPEEYFYIVGEQGWYMSTYTHTFRRFKRV